MEKKAMELVFILDKSGSMGGLESDTIGGFNSMLKKQHQQNTLAKVTTVLFDNTYTLIHDRFEIDQIRPLTEKEYFVEGTTALLDAIGRTIGKIKNVQNNQDSNTQRQVLFVIITDGLENASSEYNSDEIKNMISIQKEEHSWEFLFLGANIDAVETARKYGIDASKAVTYRADAIGTTINFCEVSEAIMEFSTNKSISGNWKRKITEYKEKQEAGGIQK